MVAVDVVAATVFCSAALVVVAWKRKQQRRSMVQYPRDAVVVKDGKKCRCELQPSNGAREWEHERNKYWRVVERDILVTTTTMTTTRRRRRIELVLHRRSA